MKKFSTLTYYILFSFLYLGFLFHNSEKPVVGSYSLKYVAFLIAFAFGFFIPSIAKYFHKRYGAKLVLFSLFPALILVVIAYLVSATYYYYSETHLFDPYLQAHPPELSIEEKAKDTFRILTLGGSTTRNFSLAENDRYPSVLQELLQNEYPESNIEVFNAGMDWYTTKHSLINYVTNLRDWHPDLVIVMHAINDVVRSFSDHEHAIKPYNRLWSHFYGPSINGAKPPTFEEDVLRDYLRAWFSTIRNQKRNIPLERYVSLDDFERHLRYLVHYLESDKTQIVLMTQPYLYKDQMSAEELSLLWFGKKWGKEKTTVFQYQYSSEDSLRVAMDAFNEKTKTVSLDENVLLVDLESEISKDLEHFTDDVHYTVKGAHRVGELVAEKIIKEGSIIDRMSATRMQLTIQ